MKMKVGKTNKQEKKIKTKNIIIPKGHELQPKHGNKLLCMHFWRVRLTP